MEELDSPSSTESLYTSWGERPSQARPLMQGDVFSGVVLPGLGDEPQDAQIVMHPCNMRQGPKLFTHITMAPVQPYQFQTSDWRRRFRIMPLPALGGPESANMMSDLRLRTPVPSKLISPAARVAALSNDGVMLLQQRMAFTETRIALSLRKIHEQMAPTFLELELQEEWVEEALANSAEARSEAVMDEAATAFQDWLDHDNKERRSALENAWEHSRIRREARAEFLRRYADEQ
ncbi:hypothetical protein AB0G95_10880 [Streptomyces virginiae]|uniref:hypothetical protein n=1 Tax=Streptomyces virginiae TaxID=1961 RepID=UPI00343201D9